MVASGAEFMLSQAMTSTIVNQGHLSEVWKEITSKDALQQLAITMGTAGLGREFGLTMPGKNSTFLSHVKYHAQKALINTSVRAVIQGGKAQDLLKKAGMQALVDAFASYGAQRIGDAYAMGTKDMDYLTHKVLHGVLGGATGALLGADPRKGAISGALSSMLAEVLAEAVIRPEEIGLEILDKAQKEGRFPGEQEYLAEVDRALRPLMDRIKLVTGVVALASGQDVEIAVRTSGNALDENFLPTLYAILGAAVGVYKIDSVIQVVCEAYDAYQKAGRGEAGRDEALKILIEKGAITIVFGKGFKGTTYLLGNVPYSSAAAAWAAYVAKTPLLKKLLEGGPGDIGKIRNQLRKEYVALKKQNEAQLLRKPGTAPGQPGAAPNAVKPGTGQTGGPVKQGNPPAKAGEVEKN